MADTGRPGYEFHGYIETPKGKRTTAEKGYEVRDILADAVGIARDKVGGSAAAVRVDRLYVKDGQRHLMRGVKRTLDE